MLHAAGAAWSGTLKLMHLPAACLQRPIHVCALGPHPITASTVGYAVQCMLYMKVGTVSGVEAQCSPRAVQLLTYELLVVCCLPLLQRVNEGSLLVLCLRCAFGKI
jgi:hypothetical protein